MRMELPMASVYEPRIRATRPICEVCKHNGGFKAHGSQCESHSVCNACKCPSKQVSLAIGICPLGLFAVGKPFVNWERVMKAGNHGR